MRMILMFYVIILSGQYYIAGMAADSQQYEVITTGKRGDGFGAHVQQVIAAFVYAELNNKEFCYRPFGKMEHNYDNDPDFVAKKEWLLNFLGNALTIDEAIKKGYHITSENYAFFFDQHVMVCDAPLKKIKKIFRANKNIDSYFNKDFFNIAVHIRRPNPHDNRIYGADVPDDLYVNIINKLRTKYGSQNPLFHIYSQGNIDNFSIYDAPDVIFHLNKSVEDTYLGMVFADVLVTGRSSFSYTAGYLSDGIVYYVSYVHAPLPHWISVENLLAE